MLTQEQDKNGLKVMAAVRTIYVTWGLSSVCEFGRQNAFWNASVLEQLSAGRSNA